MEEDLRYKIQHIGDIFTEKSDVLSFVSRVLNKAGGAVVDLYDMGSMAIDKTSSALKKVPLLTKKPEVKRKDMKDEDQKGSGATDFVARVFNEVGSTFTYIYDKKVPLLTKKPKEILSLISDVRECEKQIQRLEGRIAELEEQNKKEALQKKKSKKETGADKEQ